MNLKVSVIIVNYNGKEIIEECLSSILTQTYKNYEVVVVDNDSVDNSTEIIKNKFPKVTLIEEKYNHGFAGGNNIGYKYSSGEIIILLNNDTKVEIDYIEKFIKVFEEFPNCGAASSKIVLYDEPDILDGAGSFWTGYTMLYHTGYLKNANLEEFNKPYRVFSAKGASMITKREIIEKVGLFDSDFWHYYEEGDFCHRVINAGYDVYYYPKTTCFHKCGHSRVLLNKEDLIFFSNEKNRILSFLLNFRFPDVLFVIVKHLVILIGIILLNLVSKFKNKFNKMQNSQIKEVSIIKMIFKSIFWNVINLKKTLIKRRNNPFKGSEKDLPSKKVSILKMINPGKY
jgi:GT2 family glycosyltransferase